MFPFVHQINQAGWFHLVYFGLLIPMVAILQARKFRHAEKPLPNRLAHFKRTAFTLVMFGGLSLLLARFQWIDLFPRAVPPWPAIAAGILIYIAAVGLMRPRWRAAVEKRARVVYLFMPSNTAERVWWIVVALLAGISEEITWRGVQAGLTYKLAGSVSITFILCAVSFGLAHMIQGWKSAAAVSVFAIGFHALVWLSGSLYVAMAVHVLYDVTAGISYGRLGKSLGYTPETAVDAPASVV